MEPWGFQEEEFKAARLLQLLYNTNTPRNKHKQLEPFMRNMRKLVLGALHRAEPEPVIPDLDTKEGQAQATEIAVQKFKEMFGGNVIDARKK